MIRRLCACVPLGFVAGAIVAARTCVLTTQHEPRFLQSTLRRMIQHGSRVGLVTEKTRRGGRAVALQFVLLACVAVHVGDVCVAR